MGKSLAIIIAISTILMGVNYYGESSSHDIGHFGSGKLENSSGIISNEGNRSKVSTHRVGELHKVFKQSKETAQNRTRLEGHQPLANLGAGCVTDVTTRQGCRYYSTYELAKGLLYELKPLAPWFIQAQDKYGIDAVFLAAVSAEESGWGRYQFRNNNIFGFENCDYDSLEACVDHAASWLHTEYLTPGGRYYEGVGVADVNVHYNGRDTWEKHIAAIMHQIVNRIESED